MSGCEPQPRVNARSATGGSWLRPGCRAVGKRHVRGVDHASRHRRWRVRASPSPDDGRRWPAVTASAPPYPRTHDHDDAVPDARARADRDRSTSSPPSRPRPSSACSPRPPAPTGSRPCPSRAGCSCAADAGRAYGTSCSPSAASSSGTRSWRTPTPSRPRPPSWSCTPRTAAAGTAGRWARALLAASGKRLRVWAHGGQVRRPAPRPGARPHPLPRTAPAAAAAEPAATLPEPVLPAGRHRPHLRARRRTTRPGSP